jgi:predicted DsbA family dithiol-disulfide isomerase
LGVYSTLLFLNQGRENTDHVTDEFPRSIAKKTRGLDVSQWNESRQPESGDSELGAAQTRAQAEGIEGSPTLVISGPRCTRELAGAVPVVQATAAIDEVEAS